MPKKYYDLWTNVDKKLFIQLTKDTAYSNNWTSATFDVIDKTIQRCIDKDEIFDLISWAYYIESGDYIPADYVDIPEGIDREKLDFEFEE